MGGPMAANLCKAGFPVAVFDRVPERCAALSAAGAEPMASAGALAAAADVIITMLPDTPDVESALFGEGRVAESLRPGAVLLDMSTISPRASVEFSERLRQRSVEMLDAPVSGGEPGARQGTLSIMVGGARPVFDRVLPVLEVLGKKILYTGPNGSGLKTKLVNQIVGSLNLLAAAEGLRLARSAGLDLRQTVEAVGAGAAGSWMLSVLGPKMIEGDFAPGFSIRLHHKDLRLAIDFIRELGMDAPGTELSYALFTKAMERGLADQGNQGLINVWD